MKTEPDIKYDNLLNKISTRSGIGIGTIKRTIREYKSTGTLSSPVNKKNKPTVVDKVDDFDKNAIRQKIHAFLVQTRNSDFTEYVTSDKR